MALLIGLGNPGAKYERNRHNAGFMALDAIAAHYRFSPWSQKFGGLLAEGAVEGKKAYAFKPMSFMNLSGNPAGELSRFYKIPVQDVVAFHDELDLPLGKIRVKRGGGHGGHNGLKSLDAHLGPEYLRVRIGIGHPGVKEMVHSHVLSDFSGAERAAMDETFAAIAEHLPILLASGEAAFMNKLALNSKKEER